MCKYVVEFDRIQYDCRASGRQLPFPISEISSLRCQRFKRTCCLHLQGTLIMSGGSSETLAHVCQSALRHIIETALCIFDLLISSADINVCHKVLHILFNDAVRSSSGYKSRMEW
jgi:hypothetical protein